MNSERPLWNISGHSGRGTFGKWYQRFDFRPPAGRNRHRGWHRFAYPHFFLSPEMSLAFAAILLGVVAGVYFGFAVTWQHVAFLFAIAALLGFGISPWFIPLASILPITTMPT